jgi:hypothetical protein
MIIAEVLMILSLLICIGIMLFKILNVMSLGEMTEYSMSVIMFVVFCLSWLIGFISLLSSPTETILMSLFSIESLLFQITSILLVIETIMIIKSALLNNGREKFKPSD